MFFRTWQLRAIMFIFGLRNLVFAETIFNEMAALREAPELSVMFAFLPPGVWGLLFLLVGILGIILAVLTVIHHTAMRTLLVISVGMSLAVGLNLFAGGGYSLKVAIFLVYAAIDVIVVTLPLEIIGS